MGGMTSALGLGIILTLQDRVSAGLASIQQKLIHFKGVSQDVLMNFDAGARQMMGGFISMMGGKRMIGMIDDMFGTSVAVSRSFEMSMARVQAVSGATGETFDKLRDQALEMGRTTRFTAMDAAGAQENLIRTGRNTADTMEMLPSVLKLASAEGLTLTEAADMVSSSLRMFNMEASESGRAANILAQASRKTAGDSRSIYHALSYAGGNMGQALGYSMEEAVAWVGVLHNAVQRGSRAGTGLTQVMSQLTNPKKLDDLEKKFKIQVTADTGEILPAEAILMQLNEVRKKMGQREFFGRLTSVFNTRGSNAARAMTAALDKTFQDAESEYEKLVREFTANGDAAQAMTDIMNNTSQAGIYKLQSATENLRIALGDQLRGAYDFVIGKTADFKSWLAKLIRQFPTLTKLVAGLTAGILGLIGTLLIVTGIMAIIAGSIKIWGAAKIAMAVFFAGLKSSVLSSLGLLWKFSTPILAAIALVYGLKKAWDANLWGIRDVFDAISVGFGLGINTDEKGLARLDAETHDRLEKAGYLDSALRMGQAFYRLKQFAEGFAEGFVSVFETIGNIAQRVQNFFGGIVEGSQALLNVLKIFNPLGESSADGWKEAGTVIGKIVAFFLGLALAVKAAAVAVALFNWACNPLFVILATLTAIIAKWETIELLWKDPAKLSITNPGELNYEQYKAQLRKSGTVIDENDRVISTPVSNNNVLAQRAAIAEMESNLKRLREQGAAMQAGWKMPQNQTQMPGWSRDMNNTFTELGIPIDTTELTKFNEQLEKNFQGWNKAQNMNFGNIDLIKDSSLFSDDWTQLFKQPEQSTPVTQPQPEAPKVQEQAKAVTQPEPPKVQEQAKLVKQPEAPKVQEQTQKVKPPTPPEIQEKLQPAKQPEPPETVEVQVNQNPVSNGLSRYEKYRNRLIEQGFKLDNNDRILEIPSDFGMDFDEMFRLQKENELARLRNILQSPVQPQVQETQIINQPPELPEIKAVPQAPSPPQNAQQGGQSAGIIHAHNQAQASMTGNANAQAAAQNPVNVNVKNEIQTKIETSSSNVNLDGQVLGKIIHQHEESHQLRQGIDVNSMGVSYGGAE